MKDWARCAVIGCENRLVGSFDAGGKQWPLCEVHYSIAAAAVGELFTRLLKTGDTFVLGGAATVLVKWTIEPGAIEEVRALRRASLVDSPKSLIGETLYRARVDGPPEPGDVYVNIGRWRTEDSFYEEVKGTKRGTAPDKREFELVPRWRAWLTADKEES